MRAWWGRKKASKDHPGLRHVDSLLSGRPIELEVPISALPDQIDELFAIYQDLFELRDYRVMAVDRQLDDLWVARLARGTALKNDSLSDPARSDPRREW